MMFVSISFSLSSSVGYLNLLEVIQEHAVLERPSMFLLSVSVGRFISPPSCNRLILSFPAFFGSIRGFPMMVWPLFRSMTFFCSSSLDYVRGSARMSIILLILSACSCEGIKTLTASAVNCSFFAMFRANRTLSCSHCFANFVQLDVAHLFQLAL